MAQKRIIIWLQEKTIQNIYVIHSALLIPSATFKFGWNNNTMAHTDPSVKNVVFTVQIFAATDTAR